MYRKSLVTVWVGVLAVSLLFLGCPKKKPAPTPEVVELQETVVEEIEPPTPPVVIVDEVADPFGEDLEIANIMQVPTLTKIVINIGVGEATQSARLLEGAVADLTKITGQQLSLTCKKLFRFENHQQI